MNHYLQPMNFNFSPSHYTKDRYGGVDDRGGRGVPVSQVDLKNISMLHATVMYCLLPMSHVVF